MHTIFKFYFILLIGIFIESIGYSQNDTTFNLSFEHLKASLKPADWKLYFDSQNDGYITQLDSSTVQKGKYSISISKVGSGQDTTHYGMCTYSLPAIFKGKTIKLTCYIKTENVSNGTAGMWLRVNDKNTKVLSFSKSDNESIKGTTPWKEYEIELPYDDMNASFIDIGAFLTGNGKMWADNFHLFIDNKPIEIASKKTIHGNNDTSFSNNSGIVQIELNQEKIKLLANLGMIWGFLKYYHPAVIAGKYNWDAELFKHLPKILKAENIQTAYQQIEKWIDTLGAVPACDKCSHIAVNRVKLMPDYGYLFTSKDIPYSLVKKLQFIRNNFDPLPEQYYVKLIGAGNASFEHEIPYSNNHYPDAGIRLLSLYRYWNMVQYFFPSRYLIGEDWNKVLAEFIPKFVNAQKTQEYVSACLEIITRIHDTHANIWNFPTALESLKGTMMTPFQAKFVENKLIVTGYYTESEDIKNKIHIGDIIEQLDGVSVDSLIKKYLPLTPASNYETQLRDLPTAWQGFLLRSNNPTVRVLIKRGGEDLAITFSKIPLRLVNYYLDGNDTKHKTGYEMLPSNIGYIYPDKLKDNDLDSIQKMFAHTKGIIIDFRCYPSIDMPYTYGAWFKNTSSPFACFTKPNLGMPGTISYEDTVSNGEPNTASYNNKIVIIVDASTQSSAEYTTMALSTAPNSIVIGSTTAGADGNISKIILPGGITTWFSGKGVFYPDGTEAQRKGVKIDIPIRPTIKGITEGRDELLDKAIEIIRSSH